MSFPRNPPTKTKRKDTAAVDKAHIVEARLRPRRQQGLNQAADVSRLLHVSGLLHATKMELKRAKTELKRANMKLKRIQEAAAQQQAAKETAPLVPTAKAVSNDPSTPSAAGIQTPPLSAFKPAYTASPIIPQPGFIPCNSTTPKTPQGTLPRRKYVTLESLRPIGSMEPLVSKGNFLIKNQSV
ncbi:hypothetical protein FPQ18DRAFT_304059 [Pyronema domesticum]|nr:hypothetical protein FPQ18DRAFT_304059 [Pyronema domesticum]